MKKTKKTLRLKYRLEPVGEKSLEFQVYYMDEAFKCKDRFINNTYYASNGCIVESYDGVSILTENLRGCTFDTFIIGLVGYGVNNPSIVAEYEFRSKIQRDWSMRLIKEALKEWSTEWFNPNK
jgi:hypothetical protein